MVLMKVKLFDFETYITFQFLLSSADSYNKTSKGKDKEWFRCGNCIEEDRIKQDNQVSNVVVIWWRFHYVYDYENNHVYHD